jgi:hypothetical protein
MQLLLDERALSLEVQTKELETTKGTLKEKISEIEALVTANQELNQKVQEGKAIIEDNNHGILYN